MMSLKNNYSFVSMLWSGPVRKMKQYSVFSASEFALFPHPKDIYLNCVLVQDHKQLFTEDFSLAIETVY